MHHSSCFLGEFWRAKTERPSRFLTDKENFWRHLFSSFGEISLKRVVSSLCIKNHSLKKHYYTIFFYLLVQFVACEDRRLFWRRSSNVLLSEQPNGSFGEISLKRVVSSLCIKNHSLKKHYYTIFFYLLVQFVACEDRRLFWRRSSNVLLSEQPNVLDYSTSWS